MSDSNLTKQTTNEKEKPENEATEAERGLISIEEKLPLTFTFDDDLKQLIESDKELAHLKEINCTCYSEIELKLLSDDIEWRELYKACLKLTDQHDLIKIVEGIELSTKLEEDHSKYVAATFDWENVLQREKHVKLGIVCLLKNGKFPNREQLDKACKILHRESHLMQYTCKLICDQVKRSSPEISKIWPAYKDNDQEHVIFVVENESKALSERLSDLDVSICRRSSTPSENQLVVRHENETNIQFDDEIMRRMKHVISRNVKRLKQSHSNITMVSASPFRSKGYSKDGKNNHTMIQENCIVLFVKVKGLIPLQESTFDKSIEGFGIDVREGCFQFQVGGKPKDKHIDLKMGCAIGPSTMSTEAGKYGTLGCFLEHPEYGLCALTCAHVAFNDDELRNGLFQNRTRSCVQPHQGQEGSEIIGNVIDHKFVGGDEENAGLDVALIQLRRERAPKYGHFPDVEYLNDCFSNHFDEYCSGEICSDLTECNKNRKVAKFGASTSLTIGNFHFDGAAILSDEVIKYTTLNITLTNQIVINDIEEEVEGKENIFSTGGDSGSLVFMIKDTGLVGIGILIGGGGGITVVTPICEILKAIGMVPPLSLKVFPKIGPLNTCNEIEKERHEEMELQPNREMSCEYGDKAKCITADNNVPKENNNSTSLHFQYETSTLGNDNGDILDLRNGIIQNEECVPQNWYDDK